MVVSRWTFTPYGDSPSCRRVDRASKGTLTVRNDVTLGSSGWTKVHRQATHYGAAEQPCMQLTACGMQQHNVS